MSFGGESFIIAPLWNILKFFETIRSRAAMVHLILPLLTVAVSFTMPVTGSGCRPIEKAIYRQRCSFPTEHDPILCYSDVSACYGLAEMRWKGVLVIAKGLLITIGIFDPSHESSLRLCSTVRCAAFKAPIIDKALLRPT